MFDPTTMVSGPHPNSGDLSAPPFPLSVEIRARLDAAPGEAAVLVGAFRQTDLRLLYLNELASSRLDPEGQAASVRLTLTDFMGVASLQRLQSQILPQVNVLGRWSGECELRDVWGGEFPVTVVFSAQRGVKDSPALISFQATDRSPSKPSAAKFSDRQLLQALLEHSHDRVYFKDSASRYLRLSREHVRSLGVSKPAEVIGHTDFTFLPTERAGQSYCEDQQVLRSGQPIVEQEEQQADADGRQTWVMVTKIPLYDATGSPIGVFGRERDVSEQKRAEAERREMETQLQLTSKMESIGRLAAGVAHEVNTPTQFITDNIHFLRDSFGHLQQVVAAARRLAAAAEDAPILAAALAELKQAERAAELPYLNDEVPRCLDQSLEGLARVARIVCSLKELAHPNSPDLTPVDLNHTIETSVTVSRHEWKYVADLAMELDPELPKVPCVVDEFNQVILNLVINAAHAIDEALKSRGEARGRITVRTRREAEWALVEVEDSGIGIPEEIRGRIFEPFFTTKPIGKGTGQGLAIVRSVVEKHHHGRIEVHSEVGRGTTFVLRLPLAVPAPAAPSLTTLAP